MHYSMRTLIDYVTEKQNVLARGKIMPIVLIDIHIMDKPNEDGINEGPNSCFAYDSDIKHVYPENGANKVDVGLVV